MKEYFLWTKENIKKVIDLWETKTTKELANEIGVQPSQIGYIASQIRLAGYKLPKKTKKGYLQGLINEIALEEGQAAR